MDPQIVLKTILFVLNEVLFVSRIFFMLKYFQEMIHSLFTINTSGDVFLEKHWKSVISRSIIDYFFDAQNKAASPQDISPVIATPHHYLISIFRFILFWP